MALPSIPIARRSAERVLLLALLVLAGCTTHESRDRVSTTSSDSAAASRNEVFGSAGPIHVDDGGAGGTPVIFMHGFAGSGAAWAPELAHLRATRRAIAFDFRGHGGSAAPADSMGYGVDSLASDLGAVIDGLGLERVVLVGHSMGGSAAIDYAGKHPDRVAGIVMVSSPGQSPPGLADRVLGSMRKDYDKTMGDFWNELLARAKPETESLVRSGAQAMPKPASFALIRSIFGYDPAPALRAYPGPKLVVDTDEPDHAGSLHALLPAAPHKVIAGTSHWPQLDKPDEMNAILDEFLRGVP
jgi:pimeloyl-ACP methyl ester carboxylesterase